MCVCAEPSGQRAHWSNLPTGPLNVSPYYHPRQTCSLSCLISSSCLVGGRTHPDVLEHLRNDFNTQAGTGSRRLGVKISGSHKMSEKRISKTSERSGAKNREGMHKSGAKKKNQKNQRPGGSSLLLVSTLLGFHSFGLDWPNQAGLNKAVLEPVGPRGEPV